MGVFFVLLDGFQTSPEFCEFLLHYVRTFTLALLLLLVCAGFPSLYYEVFNAYLLEGASAFRFFLLDSVGSVLRQGVEGLLVIVCIIVVMGFAVVGFLMMKDRLRFGMGIAMRSSSFFRIDSG